jgi:transposase InsO family protein
MSDHPDAELAADAMKMAAAVRGGRVVIDGVIFHSDRGSTYTASASRSLGVKARVEKAGAIRLV